MTSSRIIEGNLRHRSNEESNPQKGGGKCFLAQFMLERLQKIIARAGIASRRHAEELIRSGQVRVNGVVVTELGAKADPGARPRGSRRQGCASFRRARLRAASQAAGNCFDAGRSRGPAHAAQSAGRRFRARISRWGRLDYAASGAVFLTNDGDLASRMLKGVAASCRRRIGSR